MALTLFKPDTDPRRNMIAFLALLLAALYYAWSRGHVRRHWAMALLALLVVMEQSNEVGWGWANVHDEKRTVFLKPLLETRDVGRYLQWLPGDQARGRER